MRSELMARAAFVALGLAAALSAGAAPGPPPDAALSVAASPHWQVEGNTSGVTLGHSVATAGDVNGDGYSDVIVGVPNYANGQNVEGAAFVYYGSATGLDTTPDWSYESNQGGALLGWSVATAGDVNGDGYSDVIVGAPSYTNGQSGEGRVYVFHGSATGLPPAASWTVEWNQASASVGYCVAAAGDVNGDGYGDVIVGARLWDNVQANEGRVHVYHGSATGLAATPAFAIESNQTAAELGWSVATAGDVNGDGFSDVIMGAYRYDNGHSDEGFAFVYLGSATGITTSGAWWEEGDQALAYFGWSVATAGDVNGDGYSDVIVGAERFDGAATNSGQAYVYHGSATGLSHTAAWSDGSDQLDSNFGTSVMTAGDVNGDGYADVIVGAPYYNTLDLNEGRAYLYLGSILGLSPVPAWVEESAIRNGYFGYSVATAGDVDGDGRSDVIVGAQNLTNGHSSEGRALVYLGLGRTIAPLPGWSAQVDEANILSGFSVARAGDVNGDGYSDVIVGARSKDDFGMPPGEAQVYFGSGSGLSAAPDWTGNAIQTQEWYGHAVAGAGDLNGDGFEDIAVGAPNYEDGPGFSPASGRVDIRHGSDTGPPNMINQHLTGNSLSYYGSSLAAAGDVNGDGFGDLIIGAPHGVSNLRGYAVVRHGSPDGDPPSLSWSAYGGDDYRLGWSVAGAGDVNGDGFSDVIAGAPGSLGSGVRARAHVYLGSAAGLGEAPAWADSSLDLGSQFGYSVASAGDVNGDGYADIVVGAPFDEAGGPEAGAAFLYHGSPTGPSLNPDWSVTSDQPGARYGFSVASAGDVNGDGFSDVLVGAPLYDDGLVDEGKAFLYLGSPGGLSVTPAMTWQCDQDSANFGHAVSSAGDVNLDGFADVLVGAPYFDDVAVDAGRSYLYYGHENLNRRRWARQLQTDGDTAIAPIGRSDSPTEFRINASLPSVFGRTRIALESEVRPLGTLFDGQVTEATGYTDTGSNGSADFGRLIADLEPATVYHWRVRPKYDLARTPFLPRGPWGQAPTHGWNEGDLRTRGAINVSVPLRSAARFELLGSGPNPSRGRCAVRLSMPRAGRVRAEVIDVLGRRVAALVEDATLEPGTHELVWNGRGGAGGPAAAGAYFVRVRVGVETRVRKVTLVR